MKKKKQKIFDAADIPFDETVLLRKDFFGWRVIHPWRSEDGSLNWKNAVFGGGNNFLSVVIIVLTFLLSMVFFNLHYAELTAFTQELVTSCQPFLDHSFDRGQLQEWGVTLDPPVLNLSSLDSDLKQGGGST